MRLKPKKAETEELKKKYKEEADKLHVLEEQKEAEAAEMAAEAAAMQAEAERMIVESGGEGKSNSGWAICMAYMHPTGLDFR